MTLAYKQAHYLRAVLRLQSGGGVLVFNGRDGEWQARIDKLGKKSATLMVEAQTRRQDGGGDIWLLMALIKRDRLDYLAQKATEMGVGRFVPTITKRTQSGGAVSLSRLRANTIEAAEQCGILSVPEIAQPMRLDRLLADWQQTTDGRQIIFCDETAALSEGHAALSALEGKRLALLIGPEGGFEAAEIAALRARTDCHPFSLGPRILRADTAMVAALGLVQARLGDWCV